MEQGLIWTPSRANVLVPTVPLQRSGMTGEERSAGIKNGHISQSGSQSRYMFPVDLRLIRCLTLLSESAPSMTYKHLGVKFWRHLCVLAAQHALGPRRELRRLASMIRTRPELFWFPRLLLGFRVPDIRQRLQVLLPLPHLHSPSIHHLARPFPPHLTPM